jgi:excisionase family DNA binding protein
MTRILTQVHTGVCGCVLRETLTVAMASRTDAPYTTPLVSGGSHRRRHRATRLANFLSRPHSAAGADAPSRYAGGPPGREDLPGWRRAGVNRPALERIDIQRHRRVGCSMKTRLTATEPDSTICERPDVVPGRQRQDEHSSEPLDPSLPRMAGRCRSDSERVRSCLVSCARGTGDRIMRVVQTRDEGTTPVSFGRRDSQGSSRGALPVLLTVDEVANLLRTSRRGIYAMIARRQLPGVVRLRRRVLLGADDLLHWLNQKRAPSPKE